MTIADDEKNDTQNQRVQKPHKSPCPPKHPLPNRTTESITSSCLFFVDLAPHQLTYPLSSVGAKRFLSNKEIASDKQTISLSRRLKTWNENYESVKECIDNLDTNGSMHLSSRLSGWLRVQRQRRRNLTDEQKEKLEAFGL
jgi:hypothetical protein